MDQIQLEEGEKHKKSTQFLRDNLEKYEKMTTLIDK